MHTGMLWFDDSKDALVKKIQRAMDYYQKKYGRTPDLVLLHPNMLKDQDIKDLKIAARPYRPVLPGHIWIGVEDKKESK